MRDRSQYGNKHQSRGRDSRNEQGALASLRKPPMKSLMKSLMKPTTRLL